MKIIDKIKEFSKIKKISSLAKFSEVFFKQINGYKYEKLPLFGKFIQKKISERRLKNEEKKNWEPKILDFETTKTEKIYSKHERFKSDIKYIAFYLPQFHPFPENNEWWGKGFTEWTNVVRAKKQYNNHCVPNLPTDLGFYDLRLPEVLEEQTKLANNYGIDTFCFYFYWFNGKILMERPLENFLNNKELDIEFCFSWANENWTRKWDGLDKEILIKQEHSLEDSKNFINYISKYFKDSRYLKVDGKPVLIIYNPAKINDLDLTIELWKKEVIEMGFSGIYLVTQNNPDVLSRIFNLNVDDCSLEDKFDLTIDFVPLTLDGTKYKYKKIEGYSKSSTIYDYDEVVKFEINNKKNKPQNVRVSDSIMLGWDNTPRRGNGGAYIFSNFSIRKYKQWLSYLSHRCLKNNCLSKNEKFIFINAWNEWAEGTYLEPDDKNGYSYLNATYEVKKEFETNFSSLINFTKKSTSQNRAILIHIYYEEVLDQIVELCNQEILKDFDIYCTSCSLSILKKFKSKFPKSETMLVENRGRDTLPLIEKLRYIKDFNYEFVCVIHSKKTLYRGDGNSIRDSLYNSLIGSENRIEEIINKFMKEKDVGLITAAGCLLEHDELNMASNIQNVKYLSEKIGVPYKKSIFPAGSMFWIRPSILNPLLKLNNDDFECEEGHTDGCMPHAVERMYCICSEYKNFKIDTVESFSIYK